MKRNSLRREKHIKILGSHAEIVPEVIEPREQEVIIPRKLRVRKE